MKKFKLKSAALLLTLTMVSPAIFESTSLLSTFGTVQVEAAQQIINFDWLRGVDEYNHNSESNAKTQTITTEDGKIITISIFFENKNNLKATWVEQGSNDVHDGGYIELTEGIKNLNITNLSEISSADTILVSVNIAQNPLSQPTNITTARDGLSVTADIPKGTKVSVKDSRQRVLGTNTSSGKILLSRSLTQAERFTVEVEDLLTGLTSSVKGQHYLESPKDIIISNYGDYITGIFLEDTLISVFDENKNLLGYGHSNEGNKIKFSESVKPSTAIKVVAEDTNTGLKSKEVSIRYYPEKPATPTDVKVAKNRSYVSATIPENTKLVVKNWTADEFLGEGTNGKKVNLNRKVKEKETLYVYVEDLTTKLKSIQTYVDYVAEVPNTPADLVLARDALSITMPMPVFEGTKVSAIDYNNKELGSAKSGNTIQLSRKLKPNETIWVYVEDLESEIRSRPGFVSHYINEEISRPWNVQVIKNGLYVTSRVPENSKLIVLNSEKVEIGKNESNDIVKLDNPLQINEDFFVVAEDLETGFRSYLTSETYSAHQPQNVRISKNGMRVTADIDENDRLVVKNFSGKVIGDNHSGGKNSVVELSNRLHSNQIVYVYAMNTSTNGLSAPIEIEMHSVVTLNLVTKFVDQSGKELSKQNIKEVSENDYYEVEALDIPYYTLVGENKKSGYIDTTTDSQIITFTYKKTPQGPYIPYNKYVTVTSKGYNTWQNFNWGRKKESKQIINKTYLAKGKYKHQNGSTYLSIFDDKGVWQGYINEKGTKTGSGKQGAYLSDGRKVKVTSKGYNTWSNFNWKKKQSTKNMYGKTYTARGKYNHVNGSTYYSLFDNKGVWQGYVSSKAVK